MITSQLNIANIKVDLMVYELYDLTYDEVLKVDPETSISWEVYGGN